MFQENKARQIFQKGNISYPPPYTQTDVCVSWCKKWSFFGKSDMLFFLETPVLRFSLFSYYISKVCSIFRKVLQILPETKAPSPGMLPFWHWFAVNMKSMATMSLLTRYPKKKKKMAAGEIFLKEHPQK